MLHSRLNTATLPRGLGKHHQEVRSLAGSDLGGLSSGGHLGFSR